MSGPDLLLAGCGNMAGAMLSRWIACGVADPARTLVVRPSGRPVAGGVAVATTVPADATPRVLLLGFKPQGLADAAPAFAAVAGPGTIVVSILAGVDLATLREYFPDAAAVVRAMPNLAVADGRGVVSLAASDDTVRDEVAALMAPLGLVEWVPDEALFDAYTALGGCGTGFVLRFVAALAAGGAALGIDADAARRIALATVDGGAGWATAAGGDPATLAARVASPGGSTQAGYDVLDRDEAFVRLVGAALLASERRNGALGAAARAD